MQEAGLVASLEQSGLALSIQESLYAFPLLEVVHVASIALVVGSIFVVDLRLMHIASVSYRLDHLMRVVLPVTIAAFVLALASGFLMFISQAAQYLENTAFQIKMVLIVLAGINMVVFHVWGHKRVVGWNVDAVPPGTARMAGLTSMLLWIAVLVAGRFVGFL